MNDNTPAFVNPIPMFKIFENSLVGTPVGSVSATDADRSSQSLAYFIISGNNAGAFQIDPTTGTITVADSTKVDFETNPVFTLTVTVADNGTPQLSTSTRVTIQLENVKEGSRLEFTGGPVTAVNGKSVTVVSQLNVIGGMKVPNGRMLTIIADAVTTSKNNKMVNVDKYTIPSFRQLGTGNKAKIEYGHLIVEIQLKTNVTAAAIQSFLRRNKDRRINNCRNVEDAASIRVNASSVGYDSY